MGVGGQHHAPAALPPGKDPVPIVQGRSGRVRKISPPPVFDPRTIQPIASRYTDWAIPAHNVIGNSRNSGLRWAYFMSVKSEARTYKQDTSCFTSGG